MHRLKLPHPSHFIVRHRSANPWWVAQWERHGEETEDAQKLTVDHELICTGLRLKPAVVIWNENTIMFSAANSEALAEPHLFLLKSQTSYIFTFLHRPLSVKQPKLIKFAFLFLLQLFVHRRASELSINRCLNITRHSTALKINLPDLLQFDHKNICDVRCW